MRHRARGTGQPAPSDDTRAKLLQAAGEVFAEVGYQSATIRQISSRAGVNVALVNYHFGDKLGLYTEVLRQSVHAADLNAVRSELQRNAPPGEILRTAIGMRLRSACGADVPDWHFRIIAHELARPTPAMARVVDDALKPIYNRLRGLIGGILGLPPDDEKTRLCTHSVMGQLVLYALARPVLARLWPGLKMSPEQLDRIADHIADFSLAYLDREGSKRARSQKRAKRRK